MPREITSHTLAAVRENVVVEDIACVRGDTYRLSAAPGTCAFVATVLHFAALGLDGVHHDGITTESVLAVIMDRLEQFQSCSLRCDENADALHHLKIAMIHLKSRTLRRIRQGIEGKLEESTSRPSAETRHQQAIEDEWE